MCIQTRITLYTHLPPPPAPPPPPPVEKEASPQGEVSWDVDQDLIAQLKEQYRKERKGKKGVKSKSCSSSSLLILFPSVLCLLCFVSFEKSCALGLRLCPFSLSLLSPQVSLYFVSASRSKL